MPNQNLKGNILEATIQAFQKKGLKFTMDDLASLLGISKKTIYTVFPDKNSLVLEMVDYCFSSIKESEQKVLQDLSLDTVGKIRAILGVLPEGYRELVRDVVASKAIPLIPASLKAFSSSSLTE